MARLFRKKDKHVSPLALDDHRVRLNFQHLEDRYIKPVTIILTKEEKEMFRSRRRQFRPMILMAEQALFSFRRTRKWLVRK